MAKRPVVLVILDGWGWREERADNAVLLAETPNFDAAWARCPHTLLRTDGPHVGLPEGQFGNSEVGHMNLGAGRVVMQDLQRIHDGLADGGAKEIEAFRRFVGQLKESGGRCHLMGLLSPGGVHAHQDQIGALAQALAAAGIEVVLHAFTDGRDTAPQGGAAFLDAFLERFGDTPGMRFGSVIGRYWAMDRDRRWERTGQAFDAIVRAEAEQRAADAPGAIRAAYARGEGDEFIKATVIEGYGGMAPGDGVLCANFRADRVRQILLALLDPAFEGFDRKDHETAHPALAMAEYGAGLERFMGTLFPPESLDDILGQVVSRAGKTQMRLAETEKYPHVTFFFNGGEETPFDGEERSLVPSPKVATYDLQPEMSAPEVGRRLAEGITSGAYDFILCNFANPDMVGHTGVPEAAVKAVHTVDACLGEAIRAAERTGATLLVTADHGNCELMKDPETGGPHTAHTLSPVPCILVGGPDGLGLRAGGRLADVAPTVLVLMGLEQPAAMTGASLLDAAVG